MSGWFVGVMWNDGGLGLCWGLWRCFVEVSCLVCYMLKCVGECGVGVGGVDCWVRDLNAGVQLFG